MEVQQFWLRDSVWQIGILGMHSSEKLHQIRRMIAKFLLTLYVCTSILDMKYNCNDLEEYIEILTTFSAASATLFYMHCFIRNRKKLGVIIEIVRNDFEFNDFSVEAEDLSVKLVKYSQYYIYFTYFSFILLTIQSYVLNYNSSTNSHDAKANGLPTRAWYPFDVSFKPYFAFLLVIQHLSILVVLNTTISIAMCFASLLIHLRAQLFHLQANLIQVCEQQDHDVGRLLLKKCLKLHYTLIE